MRRIVLVLLLFVCAAAAQDYTSVTAANITDINGNKLASGTISFLAVDNNNVPHSFQIGGGGQALRRAISCTVTAGAIASDCQVPNPANTSPAGMLYRITVVDSSSGQVVLEYPEPGTTQSPVQFSGSTFDFDNYVPSSIPVAAPTSGTVTGGLNVTGNISATGAISGVGGTLNPQTLQAVEYADEYPGTDIGAQINAAGAACPDAVGRGCTIVVPASAALSTYSTTITLNKYNESLECPSGTVLYYTGSTDGILIAEGALGPSYVAGNLSGCIIDGSDNSNANVNGIRQVNTTGFQYGAGVAAQNFTASGDIGILWQNQPTSYTDGGLCTHCADGSQNERTMVLDSRSSNNSTEIEFQAVSGGGNSFEYSRILGMHLQLGNGQNGVVVDGSGSASSAVLQHSAVDIFSNTDDPIDAATLITVENGGYLYQNDYDINTEETTGSIQVPYSIGSNSLMDLSGSVSLSGGGTPINNGTYVPAGTISIPSTGSLSMGSAPITFSNNGEIFEGSGGYLALMSGGGSGGCVSVNLYDSSSVPDLSAGCGVMILATSGGVTTQGRGTLNVQSGIYVANNQIIASSGSINTPAGATISENSTPVALTIATGTASVGGSAIGSGSCTTAITVSASGVVSTDAISWSYDTAPASTGNAILTVVPYVTSGEVNFMLCNPWSVSLTPSSEMINWRVSR